MSLAFGIAIYFILWWMVFFTSLSIGVRPQGEGDEEIVPGSAESAPAKPHFIPKIIGSTIVAGIIFVGIYYALFQGGIDVDKIPFLPQYERVQ